MSGARFPHLDTHARRHTRRGGRRPAFVDDLGKVLDEVNAWGLLAAQQEAQHRDITAFGPDVFRGFLPRSWVGVAFWYKRKGYYFYDQIQLLGIWALRRDAETIDIVCGLRALRYSLPFFSAESYYHRIRREFRTCYKDNGQPPAGTSLRYTSVWEPGKRLAIRRDLEETLAQWAARPDQAA